VERDLRIVGAGLDAEISVRLVRVELVEREVRDVGQLGRPLRRQADLVEQRGAEPERQRQARRGEPGRLAGVGRRPSGIFVRRAQRLAGDQGRRRRRPRSQQVVEVALARTDEVERREAQVGLLRGEDACLVGAMEGDGRRQLLCVGLGGRRSRVRLVDEAAADGGRRPGGPPAISSCLRDSLRVTSSPA
jgi:hypothetical protein